MLGSFIRQTNFILNIMKMHLLPQWVRSVCLALLGLALMASTRASEKSPPNIILVMADDQGYGDAGYTGHPLLKTPNMDAMAENALVFNRFYAGAPVCSPTRASVMTGRTPMRTNVVNHGHYMRPHETTIAETLKQHGYKTGHFGKWHIGSVQKESPTCPGAVGFDEWLSAPNFYDQDPYMSHNGIYKQLKGQGSELTMNAAIEFIRRHASKDKPLFTVIWFPAPHSPHKELSSQPELYRDQKHKGYFQEISLVDEQLGRLREELRTLKIHKNTLLWYCSDNGGLVKESSGGRNKKGSIYEGGLRVPSIVEWPGTFQKQTITIPASTSDMFPTLLALAGGEAVAKPHLDGIDLGPIIRGEVQKRSNTIGFWHQFAGGQVTFSDQLTKQLMTAQQAGESTPLPDRLLKNVNEFPNHKRGGNGSYPGHAALLDWPYKIHVISSKKEKATRYELYNLETDPMEQHNLMSSESKIAEKMKTAIDRWQDSVIHSLNGKDYEE